MTVLQAENRGPNFGEMEEETVKHFVVKSFLYSVVLTCVAFLLVSQCM